jgi:hypothetical protein
MQGAPNEFAAWRNSNQTKFEIFINWFKSDPMPIDEKNMFLRTNY